MEHARIRKTPTGYGVIKVDARKQITVPTVDVPSFAQTTPARRGLLNLGALAAPTRAPGAITPGTVTPRIARA